MGLQGAGLATATVGAALEGVLGSDAEEGPAGALLTVGASPVMAAAASAATADLGRSAVGELCVGVAGGGGDDGGVIKHPLGTGPRVLRLSRAEGAAGGPPEAGSDWWPCIRAPELTKSDLELLSLGLPGGAVVVIVVPSSDGITSGPPTEWGGDVWVNCQGGPDLDRAEWDSALSLGARVPVGEEAASDTAGTEIAGGAVRMGAAVR